MHQPPDVWHVYGAYRPIGRVAMLRVNDQCWTEEGAWQRLIELRLGCEQADLVLVHVTHRPHAFREGHWRPVRTVLWRCGHGKGWFE